MPKKVPHIIEKQIQFWIHKENAKKGIPVPKNPYPVITVSREFGAKGAALANELGNRLGFKVWDKDLLELISKNIGSKKELLKSLDENRRSLLEDTIFGFLQQKETNLHYLIFLVKAVHAIEQFGNSIIVGRAANYICQSEKSFHIRVVCPLKSRIDRYAVQNQIPKNEASDIIRKKDEERRVFTDYNFNRDIATASDYDLVLNSDTYSLSEMADIAIKAYELKIGYSVQPAQKTVEL